jgi:hypothetical protein
MARYDLDGPKGGAILRNVTWTQLTKALPGYVKRFGTVRIRTRVAAPPKPPTPQTTPPKRRPAVFDRNGGFLSVEPSRYTAQTYGYIRNLGVTAIYVKTHHGATTIPVSVQWVKDWQALGVAVIGWGWLEGDPVTEAVVAADTVKALGLDGYIGNAETPYEGTGRWKSAVFVRTFRVHSDTALAVSYVGYGYPFRDFDWDPWIGAGAALMPQAYTDVDALSVEAILGAADRAKLPRSLLNVSLGVSMRNGSYPASKARAELGALPWNVWTIESTPDDYYRILEA